MTRDELAAKLRLIVITDRGLAGARDVRDVVAEALASGARAVQLRDKKATPRTLLEVASALRVMTTEVGALLFVNDRMDVALAAKADGVHLGPDDIPIAAARRAAPDGFLIGASTDDPTAARALVGDGADYIGCGAVYPTRTKHDAGEVIGTDGLEAVAKAVSVPVVGIGGVTAERAVDIAGTSAAGVAVIGAVMAAADVAGAVRGLIGPWLART